MKSITSALSVLIVCIVAACDEPPKDKDGKPVLDWATDVAKDWVKGLKTETVGVSCAYVGAHALCDVFTGTGGFHQLKCFPGKNDEIPRGCYKMDYNKDSHE